MNDVLDRLKAALADRYTIECELGSGGMATVYLAHDLRHDREVAVKVLRPDLAAALGTERFLREIKIAANLTHPHILPLYDSGEADGFLYYVMPHVTGESLRERLDREKQLSLDDALDIAGELADGLGYAHGRGVIHRDMKPGNVLLSGGHAVITDFGIARAITAAGGEQLTETGIVVGTPSYMSPEQAGGESVDARSDVYALGCMLYEMLAGEPPFTGPSSQAILARHASENVPSIRIVRSTVPVTIETAIEKALAKVPADRFATAHEFTVALERVLTSAPAPAPAPQPRLGARTRAVVFASLLAVVLAGGSLWISKAFPGAEASGIGSLAVLPFDNLSGDPEQEYFVAGMHDALIGQLAQIGALRVISRTSAMRYQDSDKSLPEIARELNVDMVVEASVVRAGDSVRIQVQLIEAFPEERHLWAQTYDRDVRDVLAMHSDVVRAIAREIEVTLTPQEEMRLASARPVNPETYEAYLRGMFFLNQFTPEGIERGLVYLHDAVEKDPADPLAYAGLALGYSLMASHSPAPPADAFARAKAAALRALELDQTVAEAHGALAQIRLYREWDWAGAEQAFRRALELNPSLASAHAHYAWYLNLFARQEEALAEMNLAQQVDPLNPLWTTWLGDLYLGMGEYDKAIEELRKSLELDPDFPWAFRTLGLAYARKGMFDEAIAAHQTAVAANPGWKWALAHTYALAGRTEEARQITAEIEEENKPKNARNLAKIYAALGEKDEALRWLEAAYEHRDPFMPWMNSRPFEPLRDDPRFQDLLRRMNLPPL